MKIAFVTPWYGPHVTGGMETITRQTVTRLRGAGFDIEVLTTCIRDFHADWSINYHRSGLDTFDGVPVRRFAVQQRDKAAFDRVNFQLMNGRAVSEVDEQLFLREMFRCPSLFDFIAENSGDYLFFFVPYMFPTTYRGAQISPERSAIIPCLHDEAYAYLDVFRRVMPAVRAQLFFVHAERELSERLYGRPPGQIREVVGGGVDDDVQGDAGRFRQKFGIHEPFFLYVGRREAGKNVPQLLDYWQQYSQSSPSTPKLLLIGKGQILLPSPAVGDVATVVDLGFVSLQDKFDACAAATALIQPSLNESFSLVLMESWLVETPVLVHGHCAVTREHCRRANGGLYYTNFAEFAATVDYLLQHPAIARKMGQNGRQYVLDNYRWPQIVEQYAGIIGQMEASMPAQT